jgi:hypothetical protein
LRASAGRGGVLGLDARGNRFLAGCARVIRACVICTRVIHACVIRACVIRACVIRALAGPRAAG